MVGFGQPIKVDPSLDPFPLSQNLIDQPELHLSDRDSLLERALGHLKIVGCILAQIRRGCSLLQQLLQQNCLVRFAQFRGC